MSRTYTHLVKLKTIPFGCKIKKKHSYWNFKDTPEKEAIWKIQDQFKLGQVSFSQSKMGVYAMWFSIAGKREYIGRIIDMTKMKKPKQEMSE